MCMDYYVIYNGRKYKTVIIDTYPDSDKVEFEEIVEMRRDISQGTGNIIIRYFYIPGLEIVCKYADF